MQVPEVEAFFDKTTFTVSYVVSDPASQHCAIIDPVLDYDPAAGRIRHAAADRILEFVRSRRLQVDWLLETHVHADHLSAAHYLKEQLGGRIAIGEQVKLVQSIFKELFNVESEFATDGSQFDHLFTDEEMFSIGELQGKVLHTPGHTPACLAYLISDVAFVGDTLFMPDYGTARTDFPGGDARILYRSIQRILSLPDTTRLFLCHDYKAPMRDEYCWETTVAEQRRNNIHIHDGISEADFVTLRKTRDAASDVPRLLLPSVQVNMRAGELPPPEANGKRYLKIPINVF
jgi:glyoxylase-like metal-dependent hydrolase (beta-lactamase superfamily II)